MTLISTRPDDGLRTSVKIIGSLTIYRGNRVLRAHDLGGPKPRQILEILLLNFGHPVSKDRLIDLLWGDTPPQEAVTSVESYVSVLRRHLQPGCGRFGPLRTSTGGYLIDSTTVDLDLARFSTLLREAQHVAAESSYRLLTEALSLATGPLLGDDVRAAWAEPERRRHAGVVTAARVQASVSAATAGKSTEAIYWANQALLDDPVNEAAWTSLILGLEQDGQLAEGLRCYARCRSVLGGELGCSPSAPLREAHSRLLRATADSHDDLSDAVSALLVLNERLVRRADTSAQRHDAAQNSTVREAEQILSAFLRRVGDAA